MPGASASSAEGGRGGCGLMEKAAAIVERLLELNPYLEAVVEASGSTARVLVREDCWDACGLEEWKLHLSLEASRLGLRVRSYSERGGWSIVELACG
ncbi:hypothetical protein [Aeropyrum pernix]|nr:hypothetical protein [Aeropyrum pernix]